MANCDKLFREFNSKIRLPKEKKEKLRKARTALRDKIIKDFKNEEGYNPVFRGQGSFTLDTIVDPLGQENFDIDDGVYFELEVEPTETTTTFHNWILSAIGDHTDNIIDKNPCVRVVYKDGYHIDITIYKKLKFKSHPELAHKSKSWIESDAREFVDWFRGRLDEEKQLRRLVRCIKAWCDYKNVSGISGLVFTIWMAENYLINERDDVAFVQTLKKIQSNVQYDVSCYRPTTPKYENLLSSLSDTDKDNFRTKLNALIKAGEEAISTESLKDACAKWQRQFGSRWSCDLVEDEIDEAKQFKTAGFIKSDSRSA